MRYFSVRNKDSRKEPNFGLALNCSFLYTLL
jgi:hypothetical protein